MLRRHTAISLAQFFVAGACRPGDIEMRGADAGEEIEHPLSVLVCRILSHRPAVFHHLTLYTPRPPSGTQQFDVQRWRGCSQVAIERRQWKAPSLGEFQIGGIVECQGKPLGQP